MPARRDGDEMEDLTDSPGENAEPNAAPEPDLAPDPPPPLDKKGKRWVKSARALPALVKTGVRYALVLCGVFFLLFMIGSMYPPGVPDALLFALLWLLRYSALLLCVLSLVALGFCVHRSVNVPGVRNALSVFRYFLFALIGAVLAMFSLLIVVVVGGN